MLEPPYLEVQVIAERADEDAGPLPQAEQLPIGVKQRELSRDAVGPDHHVDRLAHGEAQPPEPAVVLGRS